LPSGASSEPSPAACVVGAVGDRVTAISSSSSGGLAQPASPVSAATETHTETHRATSEDGANEDKAANGTRRAANGTRRAASGAHRAVNRAAGGAPSGTRLINTAPP